MRIAYEDTRAYVATFHNPNAGDFQHIVTQYASEPAWIIKLTGDYVSRMVRAQDGRTSVMHNHMRRTIDILRASAQRAVNGVIRTANVDRANVLHAFAVRDKRLTDTVRVLNVAIANSGKAQLAAMKRWVIADVAAPINHRAQTDRENTVRAIAATKTSAHNDATLQIAVAIAPLIAAVAAQQVRLNALEQESNDCTKPMCDYAGPKSPLGKMLSGLNLAKWLAVLAALEAIDVKTLEHIAADVAGTEAAIGSWVARAVLGELSGEHP
jgi:hypothetical protein